jgi:D-glycero-alpha-D-manno-heptose 1-phosphate guanylyltransferase
MMEAIILAGGLGTRLRSVVNDRPKVLAPINDKVFIDYLINKLLKFGITRIIFSIGYLSEYVINYVSLEYPNIDKSFVVEANPLGTGGALKKALGEARGGHILVLNGDTFFDVNLNHLFAFHNEKKSECTLALKHMKNFERYGSVELTHDGNIIGFKEKIYKGEGFINGGVLIINKTIFDPYIVPDEFSFENDFLIENLSRISLYGYISDSYFIDIGIPDDYQKFKDDIRFLN